MKHYTCRECTNTHLILKMYVWRNFKKRDNYENVIQNIFFYIHIYTHTHNHMHIHIHLYTHIVLYITKRKNMEGQSTSYYLQTPIIYNFMELSVKSVKLD